MKRSVFWSIIVRSASGLRLENLQKQTSKETFPRKKVEKASFTETAVNADLYCRQHQKKKKSNMLFSAQELLRIFCFTTIRDPTWLWRPRTNSRRSISKFCHIRRWSNALRCI
uniref:Uncharacterized protein n=1 Tax=Caenorhabditis japonica TaxID=281687 RepID=A0A8R1IC61_CAEJA